MKFRFATVFTVLAFSSLWFVLYPTNLIRKGVDPTSVSLGAKTCINRIHFFLTRHNDITSSLTIYPYGFR